MSNELQSDGLLEISRRNCDEAFQTDVAENGRQRLQFFEGPMASSPSGVRGWLLENRTDATEQAQQQQQQLGKALATPAPRASSCDDDSDEDSDEDGDE